MRDLDLRGLGARLLQGGVAPKHVNRTLKELKHHFADLEQKALSEGLPPRDAVTQAVERLGDPERIIEEVLARPELKSWAYRWPWGIYGIFPVVALALAVVGSIIVVATVLELIQSASGLSPVAFANALFSRWWTRALLEIWPVATIYFLPGIFAAALCVFAARRDAPMLWPTIGVLLLLLSGFSVNLYVTPPPGPDQLGQIGAGVGFSTDWLLSIRVLRLLIPLILVLGPYYCWRQRLQKTSPS